VWIAEIDDQFAVFQTLAGIDPVRKGGQSLQC
jgi:hypothetical protein